ncbi:MAG TPA: glycosyltransferase [Thermoanaerobaculia bacterium]
MLSARFLERVRASDDWTALAAELPERADALALFRMLALQHWLDVSDDVLLPEINDRLSLRRFCGFDGSQSIPSAQALADFRLALGRSRPELLSAFLRRWSSTLAPLISVVSPVYRAEGIIDEFVREVALALKRVTSDFELVLVEDGSGDGSWPRIAAACTADHRVKGVKLSRNFGQHYAITAGLEQALGTYVIVMDCDLQDDPAFIPDLYAKAIEGYDIVLTSKPKRAHGFFKDLFARLFARSLQWMGGGSSPDWLVGGYSILSRRAVQSLLQINDVHRHYLGMIRWLGFPVAHVPVVHRPRASGKSSYNLPKLIHHAIDGWVSHSNRLLYISVAMGFSFLLTAIVLVALIFVVYFVRGFAQGWPSLVVLILTCTGAMLMSVGVLGLYIGKIFDQVRARPLYIIEQTLNASSPHSGYTESVEGL